MVESIADSILDKSPSVKWEDIEGLVDVKEALVENIVYPSIRPDVFTGI
jgi:SpoVK/Ycf46/Vps4 family AAA+-type ATPase